MIETFYVHLEFKNKKEQWSINLPFLCSKCGVCCTLEDFLTAGQTKHDATLDAKIKVLFDELGKRWEANAKKYDDYVFHTPCPFKINNVCSIYELRPDGCRLFPKTAFGMHTQDCPALTKFKEQLEALKKGRAHKGTYHFTNSNNDEQIKPAKFNDKQYQAFTVKLRQTGMTEDELALFKYFNIKN
jgi:Fe-S-cluster containining protein